MSNTLEQLRGRPSRETYIDQATLRIRNFLTHAEKEGRIGNQRGLHYLQKIVRSMCCEVRIRQNKDGSESRSYVYADECAEPYIAMAIAGNFDAAEVCRGFVKELTARGHGLPDHLRAFYIADLERRIPAPKCGSWARQRQQELSIAVDDTYHFLANTWATDWGGLVHISQNQEKKPGARVTDTAPIYAAEIVSAALKGIEGVRSFAPTTLAAYHGENSLLIEFLWKNILPMTDIVGSAVGNQPLWSRENPCRWMTLGKSAGDLPNAR